MRVLFLVHSSEDSPIPSKQISPSSPLLLPYYDFIGRIGKNLLNFLFFQSFGKGISVYFGPTTACAYEATLIHNP